MRSKALAGAVLGLLLFTLDGSVTGAEEQGPDVVELGIGALDSGLRSAPHAVVASGEAAGDDGARQLPPEFCPVTDVEGWFEPTQGVWQDDSSFGDGPGRRLTRISGQGHPAYRAELPMVRGRPTTLFGVDRVAGEAPINSRGNLLIKGLGHGARMGFGALAITLTDATGTTLLGGFGTGLLPVVRGEDGSCPAATPFQISSPVIAAADNTLLVQPFTFDAVGRYTLTMAVGPFDNLKVTVEGTVVDTENLNISIVPVILPDIDPLTGSMTSVPADSLSIAQLKSFAGRVVSATRNLLGDFFPLPPPFHPVVSQQPRVWDLIRIFREADRIVTARSPGISALDLSAQRAATAWSLIDRSLSNTATLTGLDRILVVMLEPDFRDLTGAPSAGAASGVAAVTVSQKVSFIPTGVEVFRHEPIATVTHELAHTLPYPWSPSDMKSNCGLNYHDNLTNSASGYRFLRGGDVVEAADSLISMAAPFMGPSINPGDGRALWVNQCTYANLVKQLQAVPDPPVVLVSGLLRREDGAISGDLFPVYQLDSTVDLETGGVGDMAIVLRDANGAELGRYPFAAIWDVPHGPPLNLIAFSHTVPDLPGVARIDLEGPAGLLDSLSYSANPPTVTISTPAPGGTVAAPGDTVRVQWVGLDPDGDDLLYTVLYSSDGGGTWQTAEYEISETELGVLIDRAGTAHRVKVIATDGVRSTETAVAFSLAAPGVTPSTTPAPTVTPSPSPVPTVTPSPSPAPTPVPVAASPISTISVVKVRFDPTLQHNIPNLAVILDGERLEANFLDAYDATGGLTRWGFPTSEVFEERPGILTQYYQRGVVDWQPEPGHTRLLVRRLAVDFLVGGADGAPDLGVEPSLLSPRSGARLGPWGHKVSNESIEGISIGFLDFFNRLGGVDAFGFPKTDARLDGRPEATVIAPGLTPGFIRQYFQAAVMEYHPGDPAPVKLGLIGDTLRDLKYPSGLWSQIRAFQPAEIVQPGDVLRQS